ncbi:MAG: hypothetical protein HYV63_33810 [Candidatus Schekmanbacteria bacterium]|nr:hypothetical protein [Candidatus Schekmanbacteria bacterium]
MNGSNPTSPAALWREHCGAGAAPPAWALRRLTTIPTIAALVWVVSVGARAEAGSTYQVADIGKRPNQVVHSSSTTTADGSVWVVEATSETSPRLWRTYGTVPTTALVDLGGVTPCLGPIQAVGDEVFFATGYGGPGTPLPRLYKTDGSAAGTVLVKELDSTVYNCPGLRPMAAFKDRLIVSLFTRQYGEELWVSDGTDAGTSVLADINPGTADSGPLQIAVIGDRFFFMPQDGSHGRELWSSDGTTSGTRLVADINPGPDSGVAVDTLAPFGSELILQATDGSHGWEPWRSDGTELGTKMVADVALGAASSGAIDFTSAGGQLFFSADDGTVGTELWVSDGTAAGTRLVKDLNPDGSAYPAELTALGNKVYFSAGSLLQSSDGTEAGTGPVAAIGTGSYPSLLTGAGDRLFFQASALPYGQELYATNSYGYQLAGDIRPGEASSAPQPLAAAGETMILLADDGEHGEALFRSNGSPADTWMLAPLHGTQGGDLQELTAAGGRLFLSGDNREETVNSGNGLWTSTGMPDSAELLLSTWSSYGSFDPTQLAATASGELYFTSARGYHGSAAGLWKSDGSAAGTEVVVGSLGVDQVTVAGDRVFFAGADAAGTELWVSDGTADGTRMVKDVVPGSGGASIRPMAALGNRVLFGASDGASGVEPWISDGTAESTVMLKEINPVGDSSPSGFTAVGSRSFFLADDGSSGRQLWQTDGTSAGTAPVPGLTGDHDGPPTELAAVGTEIFFVLSAQQGATYELWRSNGTAGAVVAVKSFANPIGGLAEMDGLLFFGVAAPTGLELWRTDGTAVGTAMITAIGASPRPTQARALPAQIVGAQGELYFAADDGVTGEEIWTSDGTAQGTAMLRDIRPGPQGSQPRQLTATANALYFVADDGTSGAELWATWIGPGGPVPFLPAAPWAAAAVLAIMAALRLSCPNRPALRPQKQ